MSHRLSLRLARLEARRPAEAEPPYVSPEPSDDWWVEFLSLVWEYRRWFSEDKNDQNYSGVVASLLADFRGWATQTCAPETLHPGRVRLLQEVRQCCAEESQGPFVEETSADVSGDDTSH